MEATHSTGPFTWGNLLAAGNIFREMTFVLTGRLGTWQSEHMLDRLKPGKEHGEQTSQSAYPEFNGIIIRLTVQKIYCSGKMKIDAAVDGRRNIPND